MNEVLQPLGPNLDWNFIFIFAGLIMTRMVMITATVPFLIGKPVPGSIRIGFTFIMLLTLYPSLAPSDHSLMPDSPMFLMILFVKEAFYGVVIGIASSIVFRAFQSAGNMVDSQRGAAQARLLGIQLGEQASIFGNFNFLLGTVIFLTIGGHLLFFKAVFQSYELLPILSFPQVSPDLLVLGEVFIKETGMILVITLQLTAPVLIAIFVTDVILGIISKTSPAINVWELGFVIRGIVGVLFYFLAVGIVASEMGKISIGMVGFVEKIIRLLSLSSQ